MFTVCDGCQGQTLYEKVAQSRFVRGVGKEVEQRPDLYAKIGACAERDLLE